MLPSEITVSQFRDYPPQARKVAVSHIEVLRRLPLAFVPLLLEQIEQYDWKFPAERRTIDGQLSYLSSRSGRQISQLMTGFERLRMSSRLERLDWAESPTKFSLELSSFLWSSGQIDAFSAAAQKFMKEVNVSISDEHLAMPRLGIAVIGKGMEESKVPLFRKLRPYGTYFTQVNPSNGLRILLDAASARASAHPVPYTHWYIDGGPAETGLSPSLITISYEALQPVRTALLHKITTAIRAGIGGPEALNRMLRKMSPQEIGLGGAPHEEILSHFEADIFTGGQGTQIFSTTFVQWTARELWRQAQPLTVLARFTPRQRQRPMSELLSGKNANPEVDPAGSLIDADMGAFLMWIDQQRLAGAEQASFLVWFEDHSEALVVSPDLPRNTESATSVDMKRLLGQIGQKELRPDRDNAVLDRIDTNEDMLDFLNHAKYRGPRAEGDREV
jgi:hypothetical protein